MKLILSVLFFCLECLVHVQCGPTSEVGNPSAVEIQNPIPVSGYIVATDDETPVSGAEVILRPKSYILLPAGVGEGEAESVGIDTTYTDSNGYYLFPRVDGDKLYTIEAGKDGDAVFVDLSKEKIVEADTLQSIEMYPVAVRQPGSVTGTVELSDGGASDILYVCVYGMDRFTRVDSDGSFVLGDLPQGDYDLRIVSALEQYGSSDVKDIIVSAGETTDIGTVTVSAAP